MNGDMPPGKIRRLVFIISGAADALIGAALLIVGLGILPVDVISDDLPGWLLTLIGTVMFIAGVSVAVYNFSRLKE